MALPSIVFAQTLFNIIELVMGLINALIPVIIALAVLFFLWGLVGYILKSDNQEARTGAKNRMFWGVIIIFVMVSIWGLVNLIDATLGLDDEVPTLPGVDGDCDSWICVDIDIL